MLGFIIASARVFMSDRKRHLEAFREQRTGMAAFGQAWCAGVPSVIGSAAPAQEMDSCDLMSSKLSRAAGSVQ
jgi:hypothetical protein